MGGGGVLNIVIHGVLRTVSTVGQTFAKGSASAPIQIGPRGGIIVENNIPASKVGDLFQTDFTVSGASSVIILDLNPARQYQVFQNKGPTAVWLQFDNPAVAGVGLILQPYQVWEPPIAILGRVQAIAAVGATPTTITTAQF